MLKEPKRGHMPDILISEQIHGKAVDALAARFDVRIMPDLWHNPRALAGVMRIREG